MSACCWSCWSGEAERVAAGKNEKDPCGCALRPARIFYSPSGGRRTMEGPAGRKIKKAYPYGKKYGMMINKEFAGQGLAASTGERSGAP